MQERKHWAELQALRQKDDDTSKGSKIKKQHNWVRYREPYLYVEKDAGRIDNLELKWYMQKIKKPQEPVSE